MNDKGMQQLLSVNSRSAEKDRQQLAPVGRHASAGTDWKMDTQMLTYSRSKDVFADLTLEGAVVQQDSDSTISVYGRDVTFQSVPKGKGPTPEVAGPFMKAAGTAAHKAKVEEARDSEKK